MAVDARRSRLRRLPQRDARRPRRLAVVARARRVVLDGPTRVNDTKRRDGTAQYLPKLAVAPDGRLDVLYYDRRADPENLRNQVSLQSSFDHGESFTPR